MLSSLNLLFLELADLFARFGGRAPATPELAKRQSALRNWQEEKEETAMTDMRKQRKPWSPFERWTIGLAAASLLVGIIAAVGQLSQ
ncbi:hypothetical protein [Streptomyces venetus]